MIEGDFQAPNWLDLQHLHHNLSIYPRLVAAEHHGSFTSDFAMRLRGLFRSKSDVKFDAWLEDAHRSGLYAMQCFVRTLRQDIDAVRNALIECWSNGQTEGQINRLKTLKRAMYGRAGVELIRARMLPAPLHFQHAL